MEKKVLSNNDLTGNELLNDLKGLNIDQTGPLISGQGGNKMSNINMKFPDLSNIEEDKPDKNNIVINNEFDRSKAIDDIKKKYNIKKANVEENNDIDLDDNELNFDEKINSDNKKEKEKENLEDINDENKFFKENENIPEVEEIQVADELPAVLLPGPEVGGELLVVVLLVGAGEDLHVG